MDYYRAREGMEMTYATLFSTLGYSLVKAGLCAEVIACKALGDASHWFGARMHELVADGQRQIQRLSEEG